MKQMNMPFQSTIHPAPHLPTEIRCVPEEQERDQKKSEEITLSLTLFSH